MLRPGRSAGRRQWPNRLRHVDSVTRFTDPIYADLTLRLYVPATTRRTCSTGSTLGHVRLHRSTDDAHGDIAAATTAAIESTRLVAANDRDQRRGPLLNDRIRTQRVARGEVDDTATVSGNDDLPIGAGDVIATRKNDAH